MGADIHSLAELKWSDRDDWEAVTEALWPYPYFHADKPVDYFNEPYHNRPLYERRYVLFAYLADVRNYAGIKPIADLRGVPEDASEVWKREVEEWDGYLHSKSWLTFEELDNADLSQVVTFGDGTSDTLQNLIGATIEAALAPLRTLTEGKYAPQIRFVFGFDN